MIKAVIIDDEKDARFLLRNLIVKKLNHKIQIIGEADDVGSGLNLIESLKPDIVFLDVQMKTGTGFDLLQKLGDNTPDIIFVTAFDHFAVDAFKFSAFGYYLLKPIKLKELEACIEKIEQLNKNRTGNDKRIKVLIENYGGKSEIQKLIISNMSGFNVVEIPLIVRLEGDRNYTHFILEDGSKVTTSKNLGEYEELLLDYGFYRIHQSTIISLRHVKAYKKANDGSVELTDGTVHKISRNRKQGLINKFI